MFRNRPRWPEHENHMSNARNAARIFAGFGLIALFTVAVLWPSRAAAQTGSGESFVQRSGTKLTLAGATFRYSGPNIEWLGLEGYGPHDPQGPRYPSNFEVDDALATAEEMGAKVVRSQTLGDSVGCELCIEPEEGKFNPAAFQVTDDAIQAARQHGMRLIIPL